MENSKKNIKINKGSSSEAAFGAEKGLVMRSTGSWYEVRSQSGHLYQCRLRGKFKIKGLQTSNPIAVGDKVFFEVEDKLENRGIISGIEHRENYIIRQSVHKTAHGHILAANIDQIGRAHV